MDYIFIVICVWQIYNPSAEITGYHSDVVTWMDNKHLFLPGVGSSYPSCPYTPCYSHRPRTCPECSIPSCQCGNHGPDISYQHSVHISTEPGHHCSSKTQTQGSKKKKRLTNCSLLKRFIDLNTRGGCRHTSLIPILLLSPGNPAHWRHPREGLCWRGRAAKSGHRLFRPRALRRGGFRHRLKQRWARRLFTALRSRAAHLHPNTEKAEADQGYGRLQTHSTLVQWTLIGLANRLKHSPDFLFYFVLSLIRTLTCCTVIGSPDRLTLRHSYMPFLLRLFSTYLWPPAISLKHKLIH